MKTVTEHQILSAFGKVQVFVNDTPLIAKQRELVFESWDLVLKELGIEPIKPEIKTEEIENQEPSAELVS